MTLEISVLAELDSISFWVSLIALPEPDSVYYCNFLCMCIKSSGLEPKDNLAKQLIWKNITCQIYSFYELFRDEIRAENTHEWLEESANDEIKVYQRQWTPHINSMAPYGYPYNKQDMK